MAEKVVIYIRVSTEEQVQGFSLENQLNECTKYANKKGYEILKVFKEEGVSAKTVSGRPALRELISYCQDKKNQVTKVLVYKYDRWSRNTEEGLVVMSLLGKYGIDVESVTEPSENNAMGKAMKSIMLVFAELDNNIKSERTIDGMVTALNNGYWPWKAPVGYKRITGSKDLFLAAEYKPILSAMFIEAATGLHTKKELAKKMNKRGFSALYGKKANEKTVEEILKKKFYFGIMEAKKWKMEVRGNHEAVTDEITWYKAHKAMFRYKLSKSDTNEEFPLRQFMTCPSCGEKVTGSKPTNRQGRRYPMYFCYNKECKNQFSGGAVNIHASFLDFLSNFRLSESRKQLLKAVLLKKLNIKTKSLDIERRRVEALIMKIGEEKSNIINALGKRLITEGEAEIALDKAREKESILRLELADYRIDKNEIELVIEFAVNFLSDSSSLWNKLDVVRKKRLQSKIFPEGVYFDGEIFRTTKISQSFELIKAFSEDKKPLVTPLEFESKFSE